ncbi:hypothetical protein GIB67_019647 [Kingdonia uniflora]|uniref:Diacylglycerol O-acyltransferase n=1 Tax=Kingdonia uniflora TaxID=39325 RepID=A0A7J7N0S4_9MAGN|nr:hypothetical protein GIB67_019647 [Kingdonia uniflora]
MASNYEKLGVEGEKQEELLPPLSPISQCLNSSTIPLTILAVFEFEVPVQESHCLEFLEYHFVPCTPRFSSVIDTDSKGVERWRKIEQVIYQDHLIVPTFPEELSATEYDELCKQYMSKIGTEKFLGTRPLWELHLIKYPTLSGASTMVLKLSHAIGDGYSYISVLFSAFHRADNPSVPLTFPPLSFGSKGGKPKLWSLVSKLKETLFDVYWSYKMLMFEDPRSAVRSGTRQLGSKPFNIASITIPLEQVKEVKSKVGGTVNDVVTGLISYVIHLYMVRMGKVSSDGDMTLLVMVNMRALKGYKSIEDMMKASSWGNYSRFLHIPIPRNGRGGEEADPIEFVLKSKEIMEKKKRSLVIYLIDPLLNTIRTIKGQKGLAGFIRSNFYNSSAMITSLIGPKEKLAMVNQPIGSFYFLVTRVPQSLTFTVATTMGDLKLVVTMEKGFIDSEVFTSCMNEAFKNIYKAACGKNMEK